MTEEELKNIEAPSNEIKLTERERRRNSFFLQMFGSLLLLVLAVPVIMVLEFATAWFLGRVVQADVSVMGVASKIVVLAGIVFAWFISRRICRFLVRRTKIGKLVADDVVDFYS